MKYVSVKHLFVDRLYSTEVSPSNIVIILHVLQSTAVLLVLRALILGVA